MRRAALVLAIILCAQIARAQATEVVDWNGGVAYSYDPAGNTQQIGKDWFKYDHAGRLLQSFVNGVRRDYEYDAYGNRTRCVHVVISGETEQRSDCQGFTVRSSDNHVVEAAYDAAGSGNLQSFTGAGHTYSYDAFNMMTRDQFADAREFLYTAGDERLAVHTTSSNSWQWTVRDMEHRPLRDYASQGGANGTTSFAWMKDYIWRGNRILASLQPQGLTKTTYHYHVDNVGTPRRITDSNDNTVGFHDYYAFGPEAAGKDEPALTRLKYTGHERDSTGDVFGTLDYMHARYYSPTVGRFLSVDPAMNMKKTIPNPQMWNRYAYVVNNPILYTDPDGREHVIEPGFTKPMTAENLDLDSAPWFIKASFRIPGEILLLGAGDLAIGGLRGVFAMARYTAQERMVIREAATILRSQALKDAVAALKAGKDGATFVVGRYEIVVSTELEAAAMTFRGMNGQTTFLLGRQALTSNMELIKTVLHETFRLLTTPAGVASAEGAAVSAKAAFDFAELAAWFFQTIRILP